MAFTLIRRMAAAIVCRPSPANRSTQVRTRNFVSLSWAAQNVRKYRSRDPRCGHNGTALPISRWTAAGSPASEHSPWPQWALAWDGAGAGLAINAGWRIACPISTPWHALGAHGSAIIATMILGAFIGRSLGNRRLHVGGRRS